MRFCRCIWVLLAVMIAISVPQHAQAALYLGGGTGNSWYANMWQQPTETWFGNIVGPYDYVRVDWVSGSQFEIPAFQLMTDGWAVWPYGNTSTFSCATGPSATFFWTFAFQGTGTGTTAVDYSVYDGLTLKQSQRLTWIDTAWAGSSDISTDPGRLEPVPEPTTLALVGLVLAGSGVVVLRRRRL